MMGVDDSFSGTGRVDDEAHPSGSDVDMHIHGIFNVHACLLKIGDSVCFQDLIGSGCGQDGESCRFEFPGDLDDRRFVLILNPDKDIGLFKV